MGTAIAQALATDGFPLLALGSVLAGLVRGFTGFGTAMVYLPFAAQILDPVQVLITLLFIDFFGPVPAIPGAIRDGRPRDVLRLCGGALVGAPVGLAILLALEPATFRYAIAAMTAVLLALLVSGFRYRGRVTRSLIYGTGALSGVAGGAVGVPGPPVILLYMARPLPIATIRANILLFLFLLDAMMVALFLAKGLVTVGPVTIGLCLLPLYATAVVVGAAVFDPRRETVYRRIAYTVIAGSAIGGLPVWDTV